MIFAFLVYADVWQNSFHFDDQHYIVENPFIRDLGNIPSFFQSPRYSSFEKDFTAHYRPLVVGSYAMNYAVSGLNPWSYHLTNLIFHAGSAFLVYRILKNLLTLTRYPMPAFSALAAGLIFVAHPFNAEAVNYITARSSVMCAFFYLLTFWCWMRYRQKEEREGRGGIWYSASLISFFLAMLSKEVAITLPVVLWLYDRYFFKESGARFLNRRLDRAYLPFLLLIAVPYLFFRHVQYGSAVPWEFTRDFRINLITQPRVLTEYLRLLFVPTGLTIDHDLPPANSLLEPGIIFSSVMILILFGLTFLLSRKPSAWRVVSFYMVWFFIVLLPTTLIPLNAILQENRGYLAGVTFAVFLGIVLGVVGQRDKRWAWGFLVVLLSVYSWMTVERNRVWKDDVTLWSDAAAKAPASARAHDNLGLAYFTRGRIPEAEKEFLQTVRINPDYFYAYYNLGVVYQSGGRLEEAIDRYRQAVKHQPNFFRAYYNMGLACKALGRLDEAIAYYREAIRIDSRHPFIYNNLGVVYYQKKSYAEAESFFKTAIRKEPRYAKAYYNLGNVYYEQGDYPKAVMMYRSVLETDPAFEKARSAMARAMEKIRVPSPQDQKAPKNKRRIRKRMRSFCRGVVKRDKAARPTNGSRIVRTAGLKAGVDLKRPPPADCVGNKGRRTFSPRRVGAGNDP